MRQIGPQPGSSGSVNLVTAISTSSIFTIYEINTHLGTYMLAYSLLGNEYQNSIHHTLTMQPSPWKTYGMCHHFQQFCCVTDIYMNITQNIHSVSLYTWLSIPITGDWNNQSIITSYWYVHMSDCLPTFEGFLPSKSLSNFMCFVRMCMHACIPHQINCCLIIDCLNLCASSCDACLRSTTQIADNWKLGRVRIAAAENQVWWTVLPPSLL